MTWLRTFGVALVVCFSLLLNGVACMLIAMSMKQQAPISDADVVVSGVGNSGNDISAPPSPRRLVRRVMERKLAPPVTDDMLKQTVAGLLDRARQGDADAAAFVFELAAAQQAQATGTSTAPGAATDEP